MKQIELEERLREIKDIDYGVEMNKTLASIMRDLTGDVLKGVQVWKPDANDERRDVDIYSGDWKPSNIYHHPPTIIFNLIEFAGLMDSEALRKRYDETVDKVVLKSKSGFYKIEEGWLSTTLLDTDLFSGYTIEQRVEILKENKNTYSAINGLFHYGRDCKLNGDMPLHVVESVSEDFWGEDTLEYKDKIKSQVKEQKDRGVTAKDNDIVVELFRGALKVLSDYMIDQYDKE